MNDQRKTKKELIAELEALRGEVAEKDGYLYIEKGRHWRMKTEIVPC